ncbi:MAG: hypothetical protein C5B55_12275 [Blastocatellia bacterium]|nr:MAG: hypothetical protein C5B55_12275 [Blastocatellia bacterium]
MRQTFLDNIPIRIGNTDEFACVARTLRNCSYNEQTICGTFNLANMSEIGQINESQLEAAQVSDELRLLLRLFLVPALVPRTEVERVFDKNTVDAFVSLGLLGSGEFGTDDFYARAFLYPVMNFLIASDRHSLPDESTFEAPSDIVFPAIFRGTLQFLKLLPTNWKGAALDLCSGTGIGALLLSRSGRHAISSDITQRATEFARFNCALNQVSTIDVVCGDLYQAVENQKFGCIVAHPPYVPSIDAKAIWRDGGTIGDSLVKRIIQSLPKYLDPDGFFFCICLGIDTEKMSFEERVRFWLGEESTDFDIIFAYQEIRDPQQVLENLIQRYSDVDEEKLETIRSEYEHAGIIKMPLGALYLRRRSRRGEPLTVRKQLGENTEGVDFERAFLLHDQTLQPNFLQDLRKGTPTLAPRLEVKVTHVVHDGSLVPADFLFDVDKPFPARARFESWMVPLLTRLDGKTTLAEIYGEAAAKGGIPEQFNLEDFVLLVTRTIELGFTELN